MDVFCGFFLTTTTTNNAATVAENNPVYNLRLDAQSGRESKLRTHEDNDPFSVFLLAFPFCLLPLLSSDTWREEKSFWVGWGEHLV